MKLLRNLIWGVLNAGCLAVSVGFVLVLLAVFSAKARADAVRMGGLFVLFLAYATAAIVCGITVGALRPLTRSVVGRRAVGGILTAQGFSAFLVITLGSEYWESAFNVMMVAATVFVIGFLTAPLWRLQSGLMPDFDKWLGSLVHTSTLKEDPNESDGAA